MSGVKDACEVGEGEILPDGRTNQDEASLIAKQKSEVSGQKLEALTTDGH